MKGKRARMIRAEALALSAMMATMNVMPALADSGVNPEVGIEVSNENEEERDKDLASSSNATPVEEKDQEIETEEESGDNEGDEVGEELENDLETEESTESSENEEDTESSESGKESLEDTENEIESSGAEEDTKESSESEGETEESTEDLESTEKVELATPSNAEKLETETEPELELMTLSLREVVYREWNDSEDGNWQFYPSGDGTCSIKPLSDAMKTGDVVIPEEIEGFTVTSIANSTWSGSNNLTSITIPDSVKKIGMNAFKDCTSLPKIDLTNVTSIGSKAFEGCSSLTEVNIPNVTSIEDYAFRNCSFLKKVDMSNVTTIGYHTFEGCSSLTEANIPNVKSIRGQAFKGCSSLTEANIPNVTSIESEAFYGCSSLTEVNIPKVKSIKDSAFKNCNSLPKIDLTNVTSIGSRAFEGCSSLTEVNIPNVTFIANQVFQNCKSLTEVNIPKVKSIGQYAFINCNSLPKIDLTNVTSIGSRAFEGCSSLTEVNIPNVTSIVYGVFGGCTSLSKVDLTNVTSIGGSAFYGCSSLTEVNLGAVEALGTYAFYNCKNLSTLNWTNNLKELSECAFYKCGSLTEIDLGNITKVGKYALFGCNSIKELTIPASVESVDLVDLPGEYDYSGKADFSRGYKLIFLGDTDFKHRKSTYSSGNDYNDSIIINELVLPSKETKAYKKITDNNNSDEIPLVDDTKAKIIYHAVNGSTKAEYENQGVQNIESFWAEKRVLTDYNDVYNQHIIIGKINVNGEVIEATTNKSTVTFYVNDGTDTIYKTEEVEEGKTLDLSEKPEREDYEFIGWYKEPECKNKVLETTFENDTRLYAGWKKIETEPDVPDVKEKIAICYYLNDGTEDIFKVEHREKGTTPDFTDTPTRENYDFIGWYKDPEGTQPVDINESVEEDIDYYAKWEEKNTEDDNKEKITVTFYNNDNTDTIFKIEQIEKGGTINTNDKPNRDEYEFTGWYMEPECENEVTETTTFENDSNVYAGWKKIDTIPNPSEPEESKPSDENKPSETEPEETKPSEENKPSEEESKPNESKPEETKPSTEETEPTKPDTKPNPSESEETKPSTEVKDPEETEPSKPSETKPEESSPSESKPEETKPDTKPNPSESEENKEETKPSEESKPNIEESKPSDETQEDNNKPTKPDTIPTGNGSHGGGGSHSGGSSTVTVVNVHEDTPEPEKKTIDENGVPQGETDKEEVSTTTLDENGVPKDRAEKEGEDNLDSLPKTGDKRNIFIYWITFMSSLSSIMFMGLKDKMRSRTSKEKTENNVM